MRPGWVSTGLLPQGAVPTARFLLVALDLAGLAVATAQARLAVRPLCMIGLVVGRRGGRHRGIRRGMRRGRVRETVLLTEASIRIPVGDNHGDRGRGGCMHVCAALHLGDNDAYSAEYGYRPLVMLLGRLSGSVSGPGDRRINAGRRCVPLVEAAGAGAGAGGGSRVSGGKRRALAAQHKR